MKDELLSLPKSDLGYGKLFQFKKEEYTLKKLFGMLLALVMVLCMITTSFAAEKATSQVVNPGGVKYFK